MGKSSLCHHYLVKKSYFCPLTEFMRKIRVIPRLAFSGLLLLTALWSISPAMAQQNGENEFYPDRFYHIPKQSALRPILSKFVLDISTGVNPTFHNHSLGGFGILQKPNQAPIIFQNSQADPAVISVGYTNWFNRFERLENIPVDAEDFQISDDGSLGFRATGVGIPLNLQLAFKVNRYKIGGGLSFEHHRFGEFTPRAFEEEIASFRPALKSALFTRYHFYFGAEVFRYYEYLLSADLMVGSHKLGRKFDNGAIDRTPFINVGFRADREMSEYFRVFARVSFEYRSYSLNLPESGPGIDHRMPGVFFHVGGSWRIPELPKCRNKACHTQVNHLHGEWEWRSRRHPFYKKQNPMYGENYPKYIRNKGKNKKKLRPY
jgi:hypothetical protein